MPYLYVCTQPGSGGEGYIISRDQNTSSFIGTLDFNLRIMRKLCWAFGRVWVLKSSFSLGYEKEINCKTERSRQNERQERQS